MGKSQETYTKKEREKKKLQKKNAKAKRKEERKSNESSGDNFLYVDKFGNFSETPPPQAEKTKVEDIHISTPKKEDRADYQVEETERSGVVTFFNDSKGYGFIKDKVSQDSIFVHVNNVTEDIVEGNLVKFEIENGPKGPTAVNVVVKR